MKHIYAEALGWLAEGKKVLGRFKGGEEALFPNDFTTASAAGFLMGSEGWEFRLKPRTVKIGSREVEAPVLDLVDGQKYWSYDVVEGRPFETTYRSERSMSTRPGAAGRLFASAEAAAAADAAYTALLRGEA